MQRETLIYETLTKTTLRQKQARINPHCEESSVSTYYYGTVV